MRAVWRAARAAVRRRRLQTFVVGLVVLLSTTTIMVALVLLDASSAPFERAFAAQSGPHAVAVFDAAKVDGVDLAARRTGVAAAAGPFRLARLQSGQGELFGPRRPLTVVGRADPGGPVDQLDLWQGRWPTGPGEVVLNQPPDANGPPRVTELTLGGRTFTVVGSAFSLSQTADAWVTPTRSRP
ncbi:hypothetical protein ACFQX7_38960 [Luedemannella flava]